MPRHALQWRSSPVFDIGLQRGCAEHGDLIRVVLLLLCPTHPHLLSSIRFCRCIICSSTCIILALLRELLMVPSTTSTTIGNSAHIGVRHPPRMWLQTVTADTRIAYRPLATKNGPAWLQPSATLITENLKNVSPAKCFCRLVVEQRHYPRLRRHGACRTAWNDLRRKSLVWSGLCACGYTHTQAPGCPRARKYPVSKTFAAGSMMTLTNRFKLQQKTTQDRHESMSQLPWNTDEASRSQSLHYTLSGRERWACRVCHDRWGCQTLGLDTTGAPCCCNQHLPAGLCTWGMDLPSSGSPFTGRFGTSFFVGSSPAPTQQLGPGTVLEISTE